MVFGTQALGLIVGPLIALALLGAGFSGDTVWRVLLGLRRLDDISGHDRAAPPARLTLAPGG